MSTTDKPVPTIEWYEQHGYTRKRLTIYAYVDAAEIANVTDADLIASLDARLEEVYVEGDPLVSVRVLGVDVEDDD